MATGTTAKRAFLRITNTGPWIPEDETPGLLEPFGRVLSIARVHHGNISVHAPDITE